MGFQVIEDNTDAIKALKDLACARAMHIIGGKAQDYAVNLCPVGTPESTGWKDKKGVLHPNVGYQGGTLSQSITFQSDKERVTIGSNVEYAPYVELGTGPNFKAPPEWEEFDVPKPKGTGHSYVKPRPFIRPAIEDHLEEYKDIIKEELHNA